MLEAYRRGFRRPAIVDFDLHLGDATNELVEGLNASRSSLRARLREDDVDVPKNGPIAFYCSVHMCHTYPPAVKEMPSKCRCLLAGGGGRPTDYYECSKNQCHRWATKVPELDDAFLKGFAAFGKSLATFAPDILFFSAGFDAHVKEHRCNGKKMGEGVVGATYETITRRLLESVGPYVPSISLLEGGYAEAALSDGLKWHLKGLQQQSPGPRGSDQHDS